MDINKIYSTDKELETNGVWVDIGDGAKLLIARIGNPVYAAALRGTLKPYKRQIQNGTLDEDLSTDILNKIYASTILLNWEGITADGKNVKYTEAKALEYLTEYDDFRAVVIEIASTMETYRAVAAEVDEKN